MYRMIAQLFIILREGLRREGIDAVHFIVHLLSERVVLLLI